MNREIRKAAIHDLAKDLFISLIANPERYRYIAHLLDTTEMTQEEATEKNINKAYKLATAFINEQSKYI